MARKSTRSPYAPSRKTERALALILARDLASKDDALHREALRALAALEFHSATGWVHANLKPPVQAKKHKVK